MLIRTERHTLDDLSMWESYAEMDKINSWSMKKKILSLSVLLQSRADVLYTSWGKDSSVLMDLFIESGLQIPVVFVKFHDRSNPDADLVRDLFLSKHDIDYHEEVFDYHEVRKNDLHWKITARKYGNVRITGIRNDESSVRTLVFKMFGHTSKNSCRPLSLWKNTEIFAYCEQNNIPLSPVYGYLGGGRWPRGHLRMHSLCGSSGNGMGRMEWEKEYYPDLVNRVLLQNMQRGK